METTQNETQAIAAAEVPAAAPILSVDAILNASDLPEEVVPVPEWGGAVKVRGFTKAKQGELIKQATTKVMEAGKPVDKLDNEKLQLLMFVHGVIEPSFTPEHAGALAQKSAGAIDKVIKRVMVLSGWNPEAVKAAEKSAGAES